MPYDALTAATEELAPARATTNFFDPTQGRDVISRYAGARIAAEGTAALSDATSRLERSRLDRAEARRRAMLFDRDERDYAEKSDYKAQRGQFLDSVSSIDPNADDYDEQISSVLRDLPMEVREDDALQALLAHKNRIADSVRTEKEMQLRREEQLNDRKELLKMRYENDDRLAVLSPEERSAFTDPETGEFDSVGAAQLAYQKARSDKKTDSKEVAAAKEAVKEVKSAELDRRKSVAEFGVADQGAFPSQEQSLMAKNPNETLDTLEEKFPAEFAAAKAYEDKKLQSEMASALARDTPDEYVELVPNATKAQKAKRRELWDLAHSMKGNAAPEAPAAAAPGVEATKVLNGVTYEKRGGQWFRK